MRALLIPIIIAIGTSACTLTPSKKEKQQEPPTIASLEKKDVKINLQGKVKSSPDTAIDSYQKFLQSAKKKRYRAEASRRIADLEMERTDARIAGDVKTGKGKLAPKNYDHIVRMYNNLLRTQPNYPDNDSVLYQLGRAHEQNGHIEKALKALTRLVREYPTSRYYNEAQFRRAEILFVLKDYRNAHSAYAAVLRDGQKSNFYERSLYKHGWANFKRSRYDDAIDSFFKLLDIKLRNPDTGQILADRKDLSRGDRELMSDTFRVISLSFSYLGGHSAITGFFRKQTINRPYHYRIYRNLGDLYFKQERIRDAADTYNAFVRDNPDHAFAPDFQAAVINAFQKGGFLSLTLQAKEEFVNRYNKNSRYWRLHGEKEKSRVEPLLKSNIEELARYHHAQAQKKKNPHAYRKAARLYRMYINSFSKDTKLAEMHFLLAESLYESGDYYTAAIEYERTAYQYPAHKKGAEAGYAALLSFQKHEQGIRADQRKAFHGRVIKSGLKFAKHYPNDRRVPAVLTRAAEDLFKAKQYDKAAEIATRVTLIRPYPAKALRKTAWTVLAHTQFQAARYGEAEQSYIQVLKLTPRKDKSYAAIHERRVASIYKQGETLRNANFHREAVQQFLRIGRVDPKSRFRPTAEYDAAASLIEMKDWTRAARVLESFRRTYPRHALTRTIPEKLSFVYLKSNNHGKAARELETIVSKSKNPKYVRNARWQIAELYEKTGNTKQTIRAYKAYVKQFPRPAEQAIEARNKIALIYKKQNNRNNYHYWLKQIIQADKRAGNQRSARTRYLAARSSYTLAEPLYKSFNRVRLTIPLKRSLKKKKRKMQAALKAYERIAAYGVAEYTTAATYWIGEIYTSFGKALMKSQRPRGLNADELEQYEILLEEQAFPFEEKAIKIHETNARRTRQEVYDQWVKKSLVRLEKLLPLKYSKPERTEVISREIR